MAQYADKVKLPHRTGSTSHDLENDDFAALTRDTLIEISCTTITGVAPSLLQLLEELASPYKNIASHPVHILNSELYLLRLLADCCSGHWDARSSSRGSRSDLEAASRRSIGSYNSRYHGASRRRSPLTGARQALPESLDDATIQRLLATVKRFLVPLPPDYTIPAATILQSGALVIPHEYFDENDESLRLLRASSEDIELTTRTITEFISASNWPVVVDSLRLQLRAAQQPQSSQASTSQAGAAVDDDAFLLVSLRLIASLWVDAKKLGVVIGEACGSFLHLRKPFQHTLAIALPLLITRWLEQNPEEFVGLHLSHLRLDGGADTLFDITSSMTDQGRLKSVLPPLQITLAFLLPDIWDVATGMRDGKGGSLVKKVAFLAGLRKAVHNNQETATQCLVSLLWAARHLKHDSDSALLSFALDVLDEVRDVVFRKPSHGESAMNRDLLTAALISTTHLDLPSSSEGYGPLCLADGSPHDFKLAYVSACCYFAMEYDTRLYQPFFSHMAVFTRTFLKVWHLAVYDPLLIAFRYSKLILRDT